MPHRQIRISRGLVFLALTLTMARPAFAQSETLTRGQRYSHENEVMVCLSSDWARSLYRSHNDPHTVLAGCFPAKLLNFAPEYRVDNIALVSDTTVAGFVYGVSESVIPRSGPILNDRPVYVVTSATVIDSAQHEVLQADLEEPPGR